MWLCIWYVGVRGVVCVCVCVCVCVMSMQAADPSHAPVYQSRLAALQPAIQGAQEMLQHAREGLAVAQDQHTLAQANLDMVSDRRFSALSWMTRHACRRVWAFVAFSLGSRPLTCL